MGRRSLQQRVEDLVDERFERGAALEVEADRSPRGQVRTGIVWSRSGREKLLVVSVARDKGRVALLAALFHAMRAKGDR